MDGLINITLINSAKFSFSSLEVDKNTLLVGSNGAGKTTILRAILFFYVSDASKLGLRKNERKKSFSEYYFEYDNSYIVYTYKKENSYILAIAYSDGAIKFRFARFNQKPNIEELFIESNKALIPAKLWIKLNELSLLSNIIPSGKPFKDTLYSKNYKTKEFGLFIAKEYDGFTNILKDIFINSKVLSDNIKKIIVSSLGLDESIDLEFILDKLSYFHSSYDDIQKYHKNRKNIEKIFQNLKEYEIKKSLLEENLSSFVYLKTKTQDELLKTKDELQKANEGKIKLENEQRELNKSHLNKKRKYEDEVAVIKEFLKTLQKKQLYYQKQDISTKQQEFNNLPIFKQEKGKIDSQIAFITKEVEQIEQNHSIEKEKIKSGYEKNIRLEEFAIRQDELELKEKINALEKQSFETIEAIKEKHQRAIGNLKDEKNTLSLQKSNLQNELTTLQNTKFIFTSQNELDEAVASKIEAENQYAILQEKLNNLNNEQSHQEELKERKFELLKQEYKQKFDTLDKEITKTKSLITPNKTSLLSKIYNSSKIASHYLYFLNSEFLHSDTTLTFSTNSNKILELDVSGVEIKTDNLTQKLNNLQTQKEQLQKEFQAQKQKIENDTRNSINKIYREKRELDSKLKELLIFIETSKSTIIKLQTQKEVDEKSFLEAKEKRINSLENDIKDLEQNTKAINDRLQNQEKLQHNEIKAHKTTITREINQLRNEFEQKKQQKQNSIKELNEQLTKALQEQERLYYELLKNKNIDTKHLQNLKEQSKILDKKLELIQSYYKLLVEYEKDKKEYFDQKTTKTQKLKELYNILNELQDRFDEQNKILTQAKNQTLKEIELAKEQIIKLQSDMQDLDNLENSDILEALKDYEINYTQKVTTQSVKETTMAIYNLSSQLKTYLDTIAKLINKIDAIFDNTLEIKKEQTPLKTAYTLQRYHSEKKIEYIQNLLSNNLNQIIGVIIKEHDKLLTSQGKIDTLIKKITKRFDTIDIGVIETLSLRHQPTNNKILEIFKNIKDLHEQNGGLGFEINLFNAKVDNTQIVKELGELITAIQNSATSKIDIEDSFILEFRVIENGNDSKYVQSLDNIGSNGTDILVKSLIYVAMLDIFKENITKKEIYLHAILDEVGILSQRYLKELITFANKNNILFINGAPDEKLVSVYGSINLISNSNATPKIIKLIAKG